MDLPGADLIETGVADLSQGVESIPALLVSIGAPRLRRLGCAVPAPIPSPEHRLYQRLQESDPDSAHSRYNALIRRLVSLERAAECMPADSQRIHLFMERLGREARMDGWLYFTDGATAVLEGWHPSTIDVDILILPEGDQLLRSLPAIKESLEVHIELASPADFIPELPGWQQRSPFIAREGRVSFHHYDLYAQALAKIERGHAQDLEDVREMVCRGLIEPARAMSYFQDLEPFLYRYPAIHPASFRRAVTESFPPTG